MPKLWAASLDEHRRLVLSRLVDAYVALVSERGVEGLTVAAVAERADLARSAVYNHVEHLHDLALFHTERTIKIWLDDLKQDESFQSQNAWERVSHLISQSMTIFAGDPLAGLDLVSHLDEQRSAYLLTLLRPIMDHLHDTVADGIASGEFVDGEPRDVAAFVWACLSGYRTVIAKGRITAEDATSTVERFLHRALVADSSS